MAPRMAIIYCSMYGHIRQLVGAEKAGIEAAGGKADVYQIAAMLPEGETSIPFITSEDLTKYDAFLFGIPTRFGNYSAQWKTFLGTLGQLWQSGALYGKYFGFFVSSATTGGGQETACIYALSSWVHQGMKYVPLGYKPIFQHMAMLSEARGGSPWGAGTSAGGKGSRQSSETELIIANQQGKGFWNTINKVSFD